MTSLYKVPLTKLNGVGEKRARLFGSLGVYSVGELINFYPRTYEDWTNPVKISELKPGNAVCIKGFVCERVIDSQKVGGLIISRTAVSDNSGAALKIVFFNNRYISSMLHEGNEYFFYGRVTEDKYGLQMTSPAFSKANDGGGIYPIYRLTAGLSNHNVRSAVKQSLDMLPPEVKDPIPDDIRKKFGLLPLGDALRKIHFPSDSDELKLVKKRLVTEELVVLNIGMRYLRQRGRGGSAVKVNKDFTDEFEALLPFEMTNAQKRAASDCINDMTNKSSPMNRLLQGDVGSGKTAVAACVCYTAVKNGFQAAFMAPTEILARQHYDNLAPLFESAGIRVELLTGTLKESEKKKIRNKLETGETDLVIGTHALITDKTGFSRLGLVVTDEQHRFGVAQRAKLLSKGENPHLLVMSATPIPRTLGLIMFGDLDISVIDELPPNRKPVRTVHFRSKERGRAYSFIRSEAEKGRQAYVVCPLIEQSEDTIDTASAEEYAEILKKGPLSGVSVGLIHGKMSGEEKDSVMNDFASGKISVLVATTVIEVGLDVPNATVMVIENAERFGLSQLHQLRGRVGRGKEKSYCVLISDSGSERLDVMCSTNDGFKIADEDLRMRGPGDFFGERQHGLPKLSIADFADVRELELSQKVADCIINTYGDLYHNDLRLLRTEVERLFSAGGQYSLN